MSVIRRDDEGLRAKRGDLDSVTEDAIREKATIPPMDLPQDQRRAHLGGQFSRRRGLGILTNPYNDPGCADAWRRGYVEADDAE